MGKIKRKIFDLFRLFFKIPYFEKWLAKKTQGEIFGSFFTKWPPNHYQYNKGAIRKIERDGIHYVLDLSDSVDWFIFFGFLELSRMNLYKLAKDGMVVFDVGANVGDVSMHLAKLVGNDGYVHSFEPSSVNYTRFGRNLAINKFNNIQLNNIGLGSSTGSYIMKSVSAGNQGMNRIVSNHNDDANANAESIHVITLDDYVESNCVGKVDLIKIDVEGFEYQVLLGSQKVISKFHPALFLELDDSNLKEQGASAKEVVLLLEKNGYSIRHSETGKVVQNTDNFQNCHFDVIAQ